jgi:anaerobic magnesium-protoporphyrin IX monomethyl ester cyclase
MGIFCLATYLDQRGVEVKIIDEARQHNCAELIKNELSNVDFVGISAMTTQLPSALDISKKIKDYNKNIKIIWGGFHPTLFPESTIAHPLIDIAVIGEGEETLWEIINKKGKNLESIKGIAFKKENKTTITPERPLLKIEDLPAPKWKLMPSDIIDKLSKVPIHTSRGCPHRCTFCVNAITKNQWRARPPEQVIIDIKNVLSGPCAKKNHIVFWEENFFVDKNRAKKILQGLIEDKINISWSTTCRADYFKDDFINDEFLDLIKKSGCELLSMGAESGSPRILEKIQKDVTPEEIIYSAKQCVKYNIDPIYSFMAGLPGEAWKDIKKTLYLIDVLTKINRRVKIIGPQTFRPYPGSPLFKECISMGWHPPLSLEEWAKAMSGELNYMDSHKLPWLKKPDVIESLDVVVRLGANPIKYALGLEVKANKILKFLFIILCRVRWKLKFFGWPIEYKLAKRFISKSKTND